MEGKKEESSSDEGFDMGGNQRMTKDPNAPSLSFGFNPADNKPKMMNMGGGKPMFMGMGGPMGGSRNIVLPQCKNVNKDP